MEKYGRLVVSFVKHQYKMHLFLTAAFCLLSGCIMSFRNLDPEQSAAVMERYAVLSGIFLMVPLFIPEQDRDIWLLEKSKAMPVWKLYLLRTMMALLLLFAVTGGFLFVMHLGKSSFDAVPLFLGAFSEAMFLGSIGFFVSGVTNQAILGYMVSLFYYVANTGAAKYFGKLGLLQLLRGNDGFWYWQVSAAALLMLAGILLRERRNGG